MMSPERATGAPVGYQPCSPRSPSDFQRVAEMLDAVAFHDLFARVPVVL